MKRFVLIAAAAATLGTMTTAAEAAGYKMGGHHFGHGHMSVEVFERDRGISGGADTIPATKGVPVRLDVETFVDPRDRAQVSGDYAVGYKFAGPHHMEAVTFGGM